MAEPQVIADFSMEVDDLNIYKVHFISDSKNAFSYFWDFGNGENSNLENPIYTYSSSGIYEVTLIVVQLVTKSLSSLIAIWE